MNADSLTRPRLTSLNAKMAKSTQAVLEALHQLNHATASDIMNWVNILQPNKKLSLTSTYRALNILIADQRVKPLHFNDGQVRYELNHPQMHHHHAICTRCNKVQVLDTCPFERLLEHPLKEFVVQYHNFEVFGLCQDCNT